ncbi:quinone-dependent dihydroorotate dehydrogenase [Parachitinimonas caeni]|uniref:Dihydroorotate dehydrogenase (quinone) n=1 Tax=Parachitinimonas caeni TaxID=3031301 RepID=A0ABT7DUI1_9NEIS|nr:quinone-dependent dihydroorotate dehydrogenase [Parachitinimonas caeni]MDK2123629.1 quinone-dependent dihydroorotate dehydrogenase [Parachitinimonas caeni]
MLYSLLRPLVFCMEPEKAHQTTFKWLDTARSLGLTGLLRGNVPDAPVEVMGIRFPNAVGLAAGLDKNGEHIDGLASLGFGFIEIGTITPRPQPGNPQPRLFRLPEVEGIINRMGFNNAGIDALLANVEKAHFKGVLGINIGKNFDTPIEKAADDYLIGLERVYGKASYITVNISSPNTKNLRQLQQVDELGGLLAKLKARQTELTTQHGRYVPLAVKIAPDLDSQQIADIAGLLLDHQLDGVIATNTTLSRVGVEELPHGNEAGGLSGAPVRERSTAVIRELAGHLRGRIPIIGVGGILSGADALEKLDAGASLIQLYSGLIYRGPDLVSECARAVRPRIKQGS